MKQLYADYFLDNVSAELNVVSLDYYELAEEIAYRGQINRTIEKLKEYGEYEEIKQIEHLHKYTVVAVVDDIYVEEM